MSSYGYGGRSLKGAIFSDAPPVQPPLLRLMPYLWPKGRPDLRARGRRLDCPSGADADRHRRHALFLRARRWTGFGAAPENIAIAVPIALIVSLRRRLHPEQAFAQLRDGIFAKVLYHAMREVAVETFAHVHTLSLRFHLERKTGGLSRVIERGTKAIDTPSVLAMFNIFPTALQLVFICGMLWWQLNVWFVVVTIAMVVAYTWFTFAVTRWRIAFRREMNQIRHRRQHQGGGHPAELRDGEVFQQRNA